LTEGRYDQSTFMGRLSRIQSIFNPFLLTKSSADIEKAKSHLASFKTTGQNPPGCSALDLWDAQTLIEARCHADTKEQLPTVMCFAAYAPMQPPIILGMLMPGTGLPVQLFMQWYNQSYNMAVNYANRNASGTMSDTALAGTYAVGVTAACGTAFSMSKLCDKAVIKYPKYANAARLCIPFTSVVLAGTIALVITRRGELDNGVEINDKNGKSHGNSHAAAKEGLGKCGLARVIWNIPVLLIPPPLMQMASRASFFKANPRATLPLYTLISTLAVVVGIYPAQAIFPQYDSIPVERLESQYQGLKDEDGEPITRFFYNKGL